MNLPFGSFSILSKNFNFMDFPRTHSFALELIKIGFENLKSMKREREKKGEMRIFSCTQPEGFTVFDGLKRVILIVIL